MISVQVVIFLLLIHFLADFGLQTNDQAVYKSTSNYYLATHVGVYSLCWLIAMYVLTGSMSFAVEFAGYTFLAHFATDYATSRISKVYFGKNDYHNGFVVVGFDQLLHYIQLIGTYKLMIAYYH